jgi:hypothetical protein
LESIRYLRHHPKSGILHYRRVVPPELRAIIGKETISATLGSKVLYLDALIRWVEIDRDAEQRLSDARHQLTRQKLRITGHSTLPVFIDIDGFRTIPGFDDKLSEALLTAGASVPAGHVVMNVLWPTFRDVWVEVFRVSSLPPC